MKTHTSLVFRGLVSPLTSSVWATILSGAATATLARASESDGEGDMTNADVEPTAVNANIAATLKAELPNFMMFIFAMEINKCKGEVETVAVLDHRRTQGERNHRNNWDVRLIRTVPVRTSSFDRSRL